MAKITELFHLSKQLREIKRCEVVAGYEPQANKKFFGAAVFQKCCRGVGEQPTFAEQIETAQYEMQQKSKRESEESQLPLKIKRL